MACWYHKGGWARLAVITLSKDSFRCWRTITAWLICSKGKIYLGIFFVLNVFSALPIQQSEFSVLSRQRLSKCPLTHQWSLIPSSLWRLAVGYLDGLGPKWTGVSNLQPCHVSSPPFRYCRLRLKDTRWLLSFQWLPPRFQQSTSDCWKGKFVVISVNGLFLTLAGTAIWSGMKN